MIQDHPLGVTPSVRVQPNAKRAWIFGNVNGSLKLSVTVPPEDGRANDAVLALLKEKLGLKRSQLELLSGPTNRNKVVLVSGVTAADLADRIAAIS